MNAKVIFTCSDGMHIEGLDELTCLPSGNWSSSTPTCKSQYLPVLPVPALNISLLNDTLFFNLVTECPEVEPAVINSTLHMNITSRLVGSVATFACPRGYGLRGQHKVICTPSGEWSSVIPHCEGKLCVVISINHDRLIYKYISIAEVICDKPAAPENGFLISQQNAYRAGDLLQFGCNNGFMLQGSPLAICMDNQRWSVPPAHCKI